MFRHFLMFFDTPGDVGAGGGAPAGGADPTGGTPAPTPAPSPTNEPSPTPPASGSPEPSSPGAGGGGRMTFSPEQQEYINRIVASRVGEVASSRDHFKTENDRLTAMMKAGGYMGDQPVELTPQELEAQKVLYKLTGLTAEDVQFLRENRDALGNLAKVGPELTSSHQTQWAAHGARMLHSVEGEAAKALGVDKLDGFQRSAVGSTFAAWLQTNDGLQERYTYGDPTLVTDFITLWSRGFVDPARRIGQAPNAAAAAANRGQPNPPQPGATAPGGGTAPDQKDEDAVLEAGWQAVKAARAGAAV